MAAGELRHEIELQRAAIVQADDGQETSTWVTYATVEAKVRTLSGNERLGAQQVGATQSHELTIWYLADVLPSDRVLFGGSVLDVHDVRNFDEQNQWLLLRCSEVL